MMRKNRPSKTPTFSKFTGNSAREERGNKHAKTHWTKSKRDRDKTGSQKQKPQNDSTRKSSDAIPPNAHWIWGTHACLAALKNGKRSILDVKVTSHIFDKYFTHLSQFSKAVTKRLDIEQQLPDNAVHQGIAILTQNPVPATFEDILANKKPLVICDQISDPRNLGALFRSCAAFDAAGLVLPKRSTPPLTGVVTKSAAGAVDIVPFSYVTNISRAIDLAKQAMKLVIGLEGSAGLSLQSALNTNDWPIAIVLGAEGQGLRPKTKQHCDLLAKIPINAQMESLNISTAGAVALYEILRKS